MFLVANIRYVELVVWMMLMTMMLTFWAGYEAWTTVKISRIYRTCWGAMPQTSTT